MEDFVTKYAVKIQFNTRVVNIAKANGDMVDARANFVVTAANGAQYSCRALLMATGAARPDIPEEIEGIELAEGYETLNHDADYYNNKRVIIIGRGNSAFEVADHLAGHAAVVHVLTGKEPIKHAWDTHFVGDLRAVYKSLLDMYQLKSMHSTLALEVTKIAKRPDGTFAVYWESDVPHWDPPGTIKRMYIVDHVIRCTGFKYTRPDLFAADCTPAPDAKGKYPVLNSMWESTVPHLYYIGTPMASRDRKSASGFIHGFRYNIRTLSHLLAQRYEETPLPYQEVALATVDDLQQLTEQIIYRMSTTAGLFQLYSFLCDLLVIRDGKAKLYRELPRAYVLEQPEFTQDAKLVMMTLEFGFDKYPKGSKSLDFMHPAPGPECAAFLHPVFRYYDNGQLVDEVNFDESLYVRHDAAAYEPEEYSRKPAQSKYILANLLNRVTRISAAEIPMEATPTPPAEDERIGFEVWAPDDPRRQAPHNIPQCIEAPMQQLGLRMITNGVGHNGTANGSHRNGSNGNGSNGAHQQHKDVVEVM
jgi:thioredoxin reductase